MSLHREANETRLIQSFRIRDDAPPHFLQESR